jgi:membrane-bound ClpP family serine protease
MKKNKLVQLFEHEIRWYYRLPILLAMLGLAICLISLFLNEKIFMLIGISMFIVGFLGQLVLGFKYIGWRWKK